MKYEDEISIADVLCLIARRWRWAVACFFLPVVVMFIVLTVRTESFEYQSVYQLAEISTGEALEKPEPVVEKLQRVYYPQAREELANERVVKINEVPTEITSPKDTLLITILSKADGQQSKKVKVLHEHMLKALNESQKELFEKVKVRIEGQLASARKNYNELKKGESKYSVELAAQYVDLIARYESRLLALQEGKLIMLNSKSSEATNLSGIFLLLASVVLGMVLAILAPLAIEGLYKMRRIIGSNES